MPPGSRCRLVGVRSALLDGQVSRHTSHRDRYDDQGVLIIDMPLDEVLHKWNHPVVLGMVLYDP